VPVCTLIQSSPLETGRKGSGVAEDARHLKPMRQGVLRTEKLDVNASNRPDVDSIAKTGQVTSHESQQVSTTLT
jgi:hypothetical protein